MPPKKKEQTKAIEKAPPTTIREYMKTDAVLQGFAELMGEKDARAHISSVIIAVRNDDKLMKCDYKSIYISALRAASLQLSVDPALKQAYLVPYGNKCTLLIHYQGLVDLAVRTGKYEYINIAPVYEGERWVEDRLSGIHKLEGEKISDKIIGWFASFKMLPEYIKTLYMSLEEIHAHAKEYAPSYNSPKSLWKTRVKVMERKTVLRILLTLWGYFAPTDKVALLAIESEDWVNGEFTEIEAGIEAEVAEKKRKPKKGAKQSAEELGYDMEPKPENKVKDSNPWTSKALTVVTNNSILATEAEATQLLNLSGMSPQKAQLAAIRVFTKCYQAGLDQDMKEADAIQYAKDNFGNGG